MIWIIGPLDTKNTIASFWRADSICLVRWLVAMLALKLNISLGLNHSELGANCVIRFIITMKLLISMFFVCHG